MSNDKQTDNVENKVVLAADDVLNIKKYCEHFNVPGTAGLFKAIDDFAANSTFENQKLFKLELCKWIIEGNHPSFKDEVWNTPRERAEQAVYELQFDKDLNEVLSNDNAGEKQ